MDKCKGFMTRFRMSINIVCLKLAYKFFQSDLSKTLVPEEDRKYWIERIEALFGFITALKDEAEE